METGKVVSFVNMKGGVSKTTMLKELAVYASDCDDKRVLVIDVDPQMNLTQSLFLRHGYAATAEIADTIEKAAQAENTENIPNIPKLEISNASISNIFQPSKAGNVEYTDAILDLNANLSIIPGELGINFLHRNLDGTTIETGIDKFIRKNDLKDKFDYIFIDCPPTYSSYIAGALIASDAYIIPVRTEFYSILGVDMLLKVVTQVQEEDDLRFQQPLHNMGMVFTAEKNNPTKGQTNLKASILDSEQLKDVPKFKSPFAYNPEFPKNLSYTIADSNAETSKTQLRNLYAEFVENLSVL